MKKYTPVFGPQELFDNAPEHVEVIRFNDYSKEYLWGDLNTVKLLTSKELKAIPIVAMRRIIKTPVWTVADREAGRLPEVGARFFEAGYGDDEVIKIIDSAVVALRPGNHGAVSISKPLFFKHGSIKPIESPAEKAQRLEDEFVKSEMKDTMLSIEWACVYERGVRAAYRRLSGDLPVPVKDGE